MANAIHEEIREAASREGGVYLSESECADAIENIGKSKTALIMGLKCSDGIVIASDNDNQCLTDSFAVAGIGSLASIGRVANAIHEEIREAASREGGVYLSESECADAIENIGKSKLLGEQKLICSGISGSKVYLFTVHRKGRVERIANYTIAGRNLAHACTLMACYYKSGITVNEAVPLTTYIIDEVRRKSKKKAEAEPGNTKVTVVDPYRGVRELSKEEIASLEYYNRLLIRLRVRVRRLRRGHLWSRFIGFLH